MDMEHDKGSKQNEEKLIQSQKLEALAVLAAGIAHDFNNMLTSIFGNAELALTKLPHESPVRKNIQQIIKVAKEAADLTAQILAFSGKGTYVFQPINLSRLLVEEASHFLNTVMSKSKISNGISLQFHLPGNIPHIKGDPTQIKQAILNLLINATEATGDREGMITIATGSMHADQAFLTTCYYVDDKLPDGCYVFLEISDTGCGMDSETKSKVFDPFFSSKFIGRGLGLPAVLGIVRSHQGTVKIYSEPDRGSKFKLLFPCIEEGEYIEEKRTLEPPASFFEDKITTLVIDDDDGVRQIFKTMLEQAGLTVITAKDGLEGLELYRNQQDQIDVVILDLTMPRMSGEETLKKLREIKPSVKVILTSGYHEAEAIKRFAAKELADFVQKPTGITDLLSKIKWVLA